MLEVIVEAFFKTQALNKVQVGLGVLNAVFARQTGRKGIEGVGIVENAVFFEQLFNDLLDRQVLKDTVVGAMDQVGQMGSQGQAIARQTTAGTALLNARYLPVNTAALTVEGQKSAVAQQVVEVNADLYADQLNSESIGRADGRIARELQNLELMLNVLHVQAEGVLTG